MNISDIPKHLQDQMVILSGEAAWPRKLANDVILYLSSHGYAVIGVEVWFPDGDVPKVVGWSEYDIKKFEDWNDYVNQNTKSALEVLKKLPDGEELYNLTWINETEYSEVS